MNDDSYVIDLDSLPPWVISRALTVGQDVLTAFTRAMDDRVTYVYANKQLVACIAPPEAGERFEHAHTVEVMAREPEWASLPVIVREHPRPRRRWFSRREDVS